MPVKFANLLIKADSNYIGLDRKLSFEYKYYFIVMESFVLLSLFVGCGHFFDNNLLPKVLINKWIFLTRFSGLRSPLLLA